MCVGGNKWQSILSGVGNNQNVKRVKDINKNERINESLDIIALFVTLC